VEPQVQIPVETLVLAVVELVLLEQVEQEMVELQEDQELLEQAEQVYAYQVYIQDHLLVLLVEVVVELLDQVVHQM
tara:strand:- start:130 stop:357 length:228 start_codon:yes stop_codon:yes gene_type:complete